MKDLKTIIDALKVVTADKKAQKAECEAIVKEYKDKEKVKKLTMEERIERLERLNGIT